MSFPHVFILFAALVGIIHFVLVRDRYARVIVALQVLAILMTFIPLPHFGTGGHILFNLATLLVIFYALLRRDLRTWQRVLILLMAIPIFLEQVFSLANWPHTDSMALFMLVPIGIYILILIRGVGSFRNEIGFLTILAISAAIRALLVISAL